MSFSFQKAKKENVKLRIILAGPSGSGKTYTSLSLGSHLGDGPIAVIDTEHGSSELYAHKFNFDVLKLTHYDPENFVKALNAAKEAKYPIVIIDSLSHAWVGEGGILSKLNSMDKKSSFNAWAKLTPQQDRLVKAILEYPGHVLVTLRTKTAYEVEKNKYGKNAPKKVGLSPIQREGLEYEFDVFIDMDGARGTISKTRFDNLHDRSFTYPGKDLADLLLEAVGEKQEETPTINKAEKEEETLIETYDKACTLGKPLDGTYDFWVLNVFQKDKKSPIHLKLGAPEAGASLKVTLKTKKDLVGFCDSVGGDYETFKSDIQSSLGMSGTAEFSYDEKENKSNVLNWIS